MTKKSTDGVVKGGYSNEGVSNYVHNKGEVDVGFEKITKESHAKDLAHAIKSDSVVLPQVPNKSWFDFFRRNRELGVAVVPTNKADGEKLEPSRSKIM